MAATFKVLSALLTYPCDDLKAAADGIGDILRAAGLVSAEDQAALEPLLAELANGDLIALQERYVDLCDKTRRLSLNLFAHVHGESRDRGQAMVDLAELYSAGGLELSSRELPDYLPLFLEYLSTRTVAEARPSLANAAHILAALGERLAQRGSSYAAVFAALCGIAGADLDAAADAAETPDEEEAQHDDHAALDAAWEETAVTFGPGEPMDGCSVDRLRIQMRAARRDARHA